MVPSNFEDGDSFLVEFSREGKPEEHVARLYYVDCPETSADSDSDRRRVLEQMRHFGVDSTELVLDAGNAATDFMREQLAEPFTVQTVFASALGRSRKPRIYVRIITASGEDFAALLVKNGHARAHGVGRATPEGISSTDYSAHLSDLEASAMMNRKGIWANSDPGRLVEAREAQRVEERQLQSHFGGAITKPVDINTASEADLQRIPGIGRVLAERIVESRPFASISDLTAVPGISNGLLERISEFVTADKPTTKN